MSPSGASDFDFIYGSWRVHNRKIRDNADPDCDEWVEFEATGEAHPVLAGTGHIDQMHVPDPPDGEPFDGFTLRLFDPDEQTWSIWWSSTRVPGRLDPPVTGRFDGGRGVFEGEDVLRGRPVKLRFEWRADEASPSWRQAFSFDGGATWKENWVMTFDRVR
jgi:hypothetical protein